jgi:hypothetical protein
MSTPNTTILCNLPDSAFEFGGEIATMIRAAGYDESPSVVIGRLAAWEKTIGELRKIIAPVITTHTNAAGAAYYSRPDEDGETIYSFTEDFEDIWTQEDQDAIEAGSTPSKI